MTLEGFDHLTGGIESIVTALSLIIGGIWVYYRFVRQQEQYPHIQSGAEIKVVGKQKDAWVVEIVAVLENKGKVAQEIETFDFELNALLRTDEVNSSSKWGGQADFPHIIAKGSFRPDKYRNFFIGPGVTARYSWIARVPADATMLNVHCTFVYVDRASALHTMETTIALP